MTERIVRSRALRWAVRCLVALALGLVLQPAFAQQDQSETPEERARRAQLIARRTMSPFCPGRTLSDCPSPYATEWRRDIRQMVNQGMTTDQIREALAERTSQNLTGEPSTALDGVLPVLVTVGALVLLVLLLRKLLRARGAQPAKPGESSGTRAEADESPSQQRDQQLEDRLKDELDKLEDDALDD